MDGADVGVGHPPPRPLQRACRTATARRRRAVGSVGSPWSSGSSVRSRCTSKAGPLALGGAKPRALLAVLLLHANEPVSAERLALALWGEDAPAGAVKTVQVHVSRLRKALGDGRARSHDGRRLPARASAPGELDARRVRARWPPRVATRSRPATPAQAAERAARARSRCGAGRRWATRLDCRSRAPEIPRLEEQRLAVARGARRGRPRAGRHAELVGELQQLWRRHPLRERLHAPPDARPLPLRPPGRRARRLPRARAGCSPRSSGSSRARSCGGSSG